MSIAINRIKSKYKDSFRMEKAIVAVQESLDITTVRKVKIIAEINSIINKILTDIEVIAYTEKMTQCELDEIFSEVYNTDY